MSIATCLTCPSGSFCPTTATVAPTVCAAGTWSTVTGASLASVCAACTAGQWRHDEREVEKI